MLRLLLLFLFWFGIVAACDFGSLNEWAKDRLHKLRPNSTYNACQLLVGGSTEPHNQTNVKLFLFHKDEYELLPDWLQYHSFMFGMSNIHVVDHMSTNEGTCKVLALYKECGLNIRTHSGEFHGKGGVMSAVMKEASNTFLVPLDSDEFLVNYDEKGEIDLDPFSMQKAFLRLPVDGKKYKFKDVSFVKYDAEVCRRALTINVAQRRAILKHGYQTEHEWPFDLVKSFYHSNGFLRTDQGNHRGLVENDAVMRTLYPGIKGNDTRLFHITDFKILHYNLASYNMLGSKMIHGAASYGYTDATDCDKDAPIGTHYCKAAKLFRSRSPESYEHFLEKCQAPPGLPSTAKMEEWLLRKALSIDQLISAPVSRPF